MHFCRMRRRWAAAGCGQRVELGRLRRQLAHRLRDPLPKVSATSKFAARFQIFAAGIPSAHDVLFLFVIFAAQHASDATIALIDSGTDNQGGSREPCSPLERPGCVRRVRFCWRCSAGSLLGTGRNALTRRQPTPERTISPVFFIGVPRSEYKTGTSQRSGLLRGAATFSRGHSASIVRPCHCQPRRGFDRPSWPDRGPRRPIRRPMHSRPIPKFRQRRY